MTHVRDQIADAFIADIEEIGGLSGRVDDFRNYASTDLPRVCVYPAVGAPETIERLTMGSSDRLGRTLPVAVEVKCNDESDCKSKSLAIEKAIADSGRIPPLVKDFYLSSVQYVPAEGERRYLVAIMEYTVNYHTTRNNPETAI